MDVQPPEAPRRFSLRLDIYPPSQVLQTNGLLYHLALASHVVRGATNSRIPLLRGHYSASSLMRIPPSPSRLSAAFPAISGYTVYLAPVISPWDEEGFSSCSTRPCHRAVATTPPECPAASVRLQPSMWSSPPGQGLNLRSFDTFEATCAFTFVTAR